MNHNLLGTARSTFVLIFIMVCAIASHGQPPVAGPVIPPMEAHWPLDDGTGTVVTEVIGGLNGILNNADNAVAWISGELGGALRLDRIDDRIIVPHNPAFDFADEDFSVPFMMRWPKGLEPHHEHMLTKGDYASSAPDETGKRWEIIMASGKGVCFNIDDDVNKSQILVPFDAFTTGEWIHVVAVRDTKNNQLQLYADGVLQQASRPDEPIYDGIDRTGSISNPQNLFIGDASRLDNPFQGDLDDIRIFRSALTEQQIVAIASLKEKAPVIPPMEAPDAEVVVEVESLELNNAEVRDLETASGKVVVFDVAGAEAKGEVELDRGVYMAYLYMFAPDPEQDAVYVAVGKIQERVYPSMHATLTESGSFSLNILEKKKYPISITFGEPGVLLDRLVIQPILGQTVTDPAEKESSSADTMIQPTDAESGPTDGRPRVIATSDGEIDDQCSMVRFLLYANEWDVEAIITSSSQYHWQGHSWAGDHWIQPYLNAYTKVYPNLVKHDPRYPTPDYLRARTLLGNVKAEGEMDAVTAGSQYIVKVLLDESDDQPAWLQAWGGMNTIARALKTIEEEHPEKMAYVANKICFFFIWEQDSTYQDYIRPHWGKYEIPTIISDQFEAIAYRWDLVQPEEMQKYFLAPWMKENILENHGALCSLYKAHDRDRNDFKVGDFRSEGDSPAFLHTIVTGLRNMESPDWGGWGGRYVRVRENTWLDPVPVSGYKYPEGRWYTRTAWGRNSLRKGTTTTAEQRREYFKPMWRWTEALQNDFASRADWCVKSFAQANHPPVVVLGYAADLKVRPEAKVKLSAQGTNDPDGDELKYRWWQYREAGSYDGTIEIRDAGKQDASFTVPDDAGKGKTIHIICEVTDTGTPQLTRYQRVIVTIEK